MTDPESTTDNAPHLNRFALLAFGLFALLWVNLDKWFIDLKQWLSWRVDCSWCNRRKSGCPLALNITHGICKPCLDNQKKLLSLRTDAGTVK